MLVFSICSAIFANHHQDTLFSSQEDKMIIDFRMRPPFKSFTKMGGLFGPEGSVHCFPLNGDDAWPVPSADKEDMELFLKEMNEAGITQGCLLGRRSSTVWSGVEDRDIYELCKLYPDKFYGFGAIDVSEDILFSLKLIEECKSKYGFKGMVCEPGNSSHPCYADDKRLYPFYARCTELGMIVVISMSQFLGPNVSYSDPARVQNVCRDFPNGKFVIAHAGYPHIMEAIGACLAEKNLWIIPDVYWTNLNACGRDLWTEGAIYLQGHKILFGTAYPFRGLPQSVKVMQDLDLPKEVYERIMYKNAVELLQISER